MRNLQKILALVLALVMSVSLVTTAGAAFQDEADISASYKEAIDVLNGLEVFKGYNNGATFDPKGSITRAEVAAIIYRIVTGDVEDVQASIYSSYGQFTDVLDGSWYAGYVNYCANAGYIKGRGNKIFAPQDHVKGYEALAMILRAVGYDKNNEFTGSSWQVRTASTARERGILKNVNSSLLGEDATREMVAEILFQSIIIPTVNFNANTLSYTEKGAKETLGYESLKLEQIKGVVTANEYADLEDTDTLSDGKTRMLVNGSNYTLDYTSTLEDIGETRVAYIQGSKVLVLGGKDANNTIWETNSEVKSGDFKADKDFQSTTGLKRNDDTQEFLNFGPGTNWKSDWRIRYEFEVTASTTVGNDVQTIINRATRESGFAIPSTSYNLDATVNTTSNTYSYTNRDNNESVDIRSESSMWIVTYTRTFAKDTDITSLHQNNIEYIFDIADKKVDVTRQYERGEVYVGTTSTKDISDELSFKQFKDEYIKEDDEDLITENENGNWLKVIDNNLDGTADYVLKTIYTVAQVTRVKDSDITLDVKNINLTDGDSLNELNDEDVISSDTLEKDDVVYYAMIDGKAQTYKASYVTATIDKVNRNTLTATTTDGTEYVESGVHEHIESDAFESGVRSLAGKVSYDLYFDRGGYLAAFAKTDNSGDFVLITDAWYNKTKSADEYAVKAYIDGKIQVRDVTENGDLFISGDMGDVMNNGWKALKFLGGVNENNGALGRNGEKAALNARGGASTNQIKTTVASLSADGTLLPVDNSAVASRNDHYMIAVKNNVIPTDKYEARGTIYESTYLTNINDTAYNYENTRTTDVEVRALTDTIYYVVYEDNFEDIHVDQYTGYGDAPSISSDKIEDVYAVCTFNSYTSGVNEDRAIYTADVVVIECNDKYDGKSDIVFIYDDESVASNVKIDYVDMIDKDGNIKEDVAVNLKDSDVFVYDRAGYKKLVPGLYRMSLNGSADNEYIVRGPLTPKEIEDAKCFTTGFVRQTVTSSKQYVDIHPTYNIDGALGNSNRQLVNYAGYLLDNNGNVTNEQSIGTDANVVRYRVDNENFYTLSYGEISYNDGAAEMEKDDVSYVMTPKADARTDKERYDGFTADSRNYNWNRVLVRYDDNKIVYAISFANVIDQDDDQYVTSNNRWVNFDFAAWGGVAGYVSSTSDYITNQGAWGMVQPSKSAAAPVVTEVSIYGVPLTAGNPETRDYYQVKDYTGNAVVVKNLGDGWNSTTIPPEVPTEGGTFTVQSFDGTKKYTLVVNKARTDTALYRNGSPISTSNPLFDGDKDRDLTVGDYVKQFKVYGTDGKVLPDGSYTITWEILDAAKKNLYGQDNVYMQVQSVTATVTAEDGTTFKVYSWGNVPVNTDVDALVKGANDLVANATVDNLNEITNKVTELNGYLTSGKYNDVALTEADKIAIQGAIDALNAKKAELNKPEEPANVTVNTVNFEVKWLDPATQQPAFAADAVTIDKTTLYDATTGKLTVKAADLTVTGWENFKFESVTATINNTEMATGELAATADSWTLDLSDKTGDVSVNLAVVISYAKLAGQDPAKPEPTVPDEDKPSVDPAPGDDNDDFTDYDPSASSRRARVRAGETTDLGNPYYVVWNIKQATSFRLYSYNVNKIQVYKNGAPQTGTVSLPNGNGGTVEYSPSEGNVLYIARVWVTEENYLSDNWSIDLYPVYGEALKTLTPAVAKDGTVTVTGAATEANVSYYTAETSQASAWANWTTETTFTAPAAWTPVTDNTVAVEKGFVIAVEVTDGKVVAIGETEFDITSAPNAIGDLTVTVAEDGAVTVTGAATEANVSLYTADASQASVWADWTTDTEFTAPTDWTALEDSTVTGTGYVIAVEVTDGKVVAIGEVDFDITPAPVGETVAVKVVVPQKKGDEGYVDEKTHLTLSTAVVEKGKETVIELTPDENYSNPTTITKVTTTGTKEIVMLPNVEWSYESGKLTIKANAEIAGDITIYARAVYVPEVKIILHDSDNNQLTSTSIKAESKNPIHKGDVIKGIEIVLSAESPWQVNTQDMQIQMVEKEEPTRSVDDGTTLTSTYLPATKTITLTGADPDATDEEGNPITTITGDIIITNAFTSTTPTCTVTVQDADKTELGKATLASGESLSAVTIDISESSTGLRIKSVKLGTTDITAQTTLDENGILSFSSTTKITEDTVISVEFDDVVKVLEFTVDETGARKDLAKVATGLTREYILTTRSPANLITSLQSAGMPRSDVENYLRGTVVAENALTNEAVAAEGKKDGTHYLVVVDYETETEENHVKYIGGAEIPKDITVSYTVTVVTTDENGKDLGLNVQADPETITKQSGETLGADDVITLTGINGYDMPPATVVVKEGSKTISTLHYTYDAVAGTITFKNYKVTGDITITPGPAIKSLGQLVNVKASLSGEVTAEREDGTKGTNTIFEYLLIQNNLTTAGGVEILNLRTGMTLDEIKATVSPAEGADWTTDALLPTDNTSDCYLLVVESETDEEDENYRNPINVGFGIVAAKTVKGETGVNETAATLDSAGDWATDATAKSYWSEDAADTVIVELSATDVEKAAGSADGTGSDDGYWIGITFSLGEVEVDTIKQGLTLTSTEEVNATGDEYSVYFDAETVSKNGGVGYIVAYNGNKLVRTYIVDFSDVTLAAAADEATE